MRSKFAAVFFGSLLAVAVVVAPAAAGGGHTYKAPNQGAEKFVLTADNYAVNCDCPKPGKKIEGKFGRKIYVHSWKPIDKVTIKSGSKAEIVFAKFGKKDGKYFGVIKLTQDVSNYVVWTCPKEV